jgi:putative membrane protein
VQFELILILVLGILAGIITGLIPGIHINLVSTLLVTFSPFLLQHTSLLSLVLFIIAMSTTHSFVDAIPSIFLGAPDAAYAASMLPGHRLLHKGQGYAAVYWTVVGSFFALLLCVLLIVPLLKLIPFLVSSTKEFLGYLLVVLVALMIVLSKRIVKSTLAFFLAGILGYVVLNSSVQEPLMPLLSGLFGVSLLLVSFFETSTFPLQTLHLPAISKGEQAKALGAGTLAGVCTAIFPGLGPAQGAVLALQFFKEITSEGFLILTGALNTVNFVISLITFYTLDKARNGSIVAINTLVKSITFFDLVYFFIVSVIVGAMCVFVTLFIARRASLLMNILPYKKVVIGVIVLIVLVTFFLGSWQGVFVLLLATSAGIVINALGVPKHFGMGCLLLPTILYFL